MVMTPSSGSAPYATASDFAERYDIRTIGDLLSDLGARLPSGQVLTSSRLTYLLMQASGQVEAAAMAGKRYTTDDLAALTGNSKEYLKGIVCDLVIWILLGRRPTREGGVPEIVKGALEALELIRHGQRIFGFTEVQDAGKNVIVADTPPDLLTSRGRRLFGDLTGSNDHAGDRW